MGSSHSDRLSGAIGAGGRRLRPVSASASAATVFISLVIVREVLLSVVAWRNYLLVHDYINGAATEADLDAADASTLTALAASLPLRLLLWLSAGVAFLVWQWRARTNAEAMSGRDAHRRSRAWVVGAWITPVVSLWYPYQVASDVWRASAPRRPVSDALVKGWWASFLLAGFVKPVQWRIAGKEPESEADFIAIANVTTLLTVLVLAAGVLLILVIRRVTAWQTRTSQPAGSVR